MDTIKYKAFCELTDDNLLVNNYGDTFEIGVDYKIDGNLKYGNEGNGFHFASTFVDCFRFVNSDSPILCEVLVSGKVIPYDDEYYGYYDMGVSEYIKIVRFVVSVVVLIQMCCGNVCL